MKIPYIFNRFSFNFLVISWIVAFVTFWGFFFYSVAVEYYETVTYGPRYGSGTPFVLVTVFIFYIYITIVSIVSSCLLFIEFSPKFRIKNQKFLNIYNNIIVRFLATIIAVIQIGCCIFVLFNPVEI